MKSFTFRPLPVLALLCAHIGQPAGAQPVYRCGNSYSQTPCAGAIAIDANDTRTDAQRAEAREGLARDKALLKEIEVTRRKEEVQALARQKMALASEAQAARAAKAEAKLQAREQAHAKQAAKGAHVGSKKQRSLHGDKEVFTVRVDTGKPKTTSK